MLDYIQKHKKTIGIVLIILLIIFGIATYMRGEVLKNSTEANLDNPKRSDKQYEDTFYVNQLDEKEKAAYDIMVQHLEGFAGGLVEFEQPLTGKEYTRVTSAIVYGEKDYFYGFFEIPMTKDNKNVKHDVDSILEVKDEIISKCILFQSAAKDLSAKGEYDENGKVMNLDAILDDITQVDEAKKANVLEQEAKIDSILKQILADMPKEYGMKESIDYFVKYLRDNVKDSTLNPNAEQKISSMDQVLKELYIPNNTSALIDGYAMTNAYNRILVKLCNMAGIEAHIVTGMWNKKEAYSLVCTNFGDKEIYVDGAGKYYGSLGNQKYLNQQEARAHLSFVDYFDYGIEDEKK